MDNEPDRMRLLSEQLTRAEAMIEGLTRKVDKLQTAVGLICGKLGVRVTELREFHARRAAKTPPPAPIPRG